MKEVDGMVSLSAAESPGKPGLLRLSKTLSASQALEHLGRGILAVPGILGDAGSFSKYLAVSLLPGRCLRGVGSHGFGFRRRWRAGAGFGLMTVVSPLPRSSSAVSACLWWISRVSPVSTAAPLNGASISMSSWMPDSAVRTAASLTLLTFGRLAPASDSITWNSNSNGPTLTLSPLLSVVSPMIRTPFTSVPFLLPKSRNETVWPSTIRTQWCLLTRSLPGRKWQSSARPIKNFGPGTLSTCPTLLPTRTLS